MSNPASTPHSVPRSRLVAVLAVAVLAISSAAVIVRAIDGIHPLAIALWRTLLVALLLLPRAKRVSLRDAALVTLSGAVLAAHFASWFASLHLTTVMRSTVLVCTGPVWAGFFEWAATRRPPPARLWIGLGIAMTGVGLMAGSGGTATWEGDLLALFGAVCAGAYWVLGRSVRPRVGIATYGGLVCLAAAAALLPVCLATDVPIHGFSLPDWALVAALALGPQLLGHNGLNWALRYLPASTVSSLTLLEPVGATILASIFLGEEPPVLGIVGAGAAVIGVAYAVRTPEATRTTAEEAADPSRPPPRPPG